MSWAEVPFYIMSPLIKGVGNKKLEWYLSNFAEVLTS